MENSFQIFLIIFEIQQKKKGYSGTAIFSKIKPLSESYGIGDELDSEGRVITLEFENFFLVNVYTPNSKPDLSRVDYRKDIWDKNFLKHLKKLEKKKPVITCGDFNVLKQTKPQLQGLETLALQIKKENLLKCI